MAKCEQGYLCEVCGEEVADITESDLYLRYVIGELDPETLHTTPERHLRCNPVLAQFIVDEGFEPVAAEGAFDKRRLDPEFVRRREGLVTRGWRRLLELARMEGLPITEYPLLEVRERLRAKANPSQGGGPATREGAPSPQRSPAPAPEA